MLNKLAWRNVRRSARDYLVFFLTMTLVTALMSAFNSMIFSKDVLKMSQMDNLMGMMIGVATFFIVLIVAWLINYMVRFMLDKRSREFGTYLLIGMKKSKWPDSICVRMFSLVFLPFLPEPFSEYFFNRY